MKVFKFRKHFVFCFQGFLCKWKVNRMNFVNFARAVTFYCCILILVKL